MNYTVNVTDKIHNTDHEIHTKKSYSNLLWNSIGFIIFSSRTLPKFDQQVIRYDFRHRSDALSEQKICSMILVPIPINSAIVRVNFLIRN